MVRDDFLRIPTRVTKIASSIYFKQMHNKARNYGGISTSHDKVGRQEASQRNADSENAGLTFKEENNLLAERRGATPGRRCTKRRAVTIKQKETT